MINDMLRAVVFDLDGTLGDTLPLCIESFRRAVREIDGRELKDEEITRYFGVSDLGVLQRLFESRPDLVASAMKRTIDHYKNLHGVMAPAPFPGSVSMLARLREAGMIMSVVTGKCIETARITLELFGMSEFFPMVEPGSPRRVIKGECLLRIADHYALKPDEMIYVGDTVMDIDACREVGVPIVSAGWARTADVEQLAKRNGEHLQTDFNSFVTYILSLVETPCV